MFSFVNIKKRCVVAGPEPKSQKSMQRSTQYNKNFFGSNSKIVFKQFAKEAKMLNKRMEVSDGIKKI